MAKTALLLGLVCPASANGVARLRRESLALYSIGFWTLAANAQAPCPGATNPIGLVLDFQTSDISEDTNVLGGFPGDVATNFYAEAACVGTGWEAVRRHRRSAADPGPDSEEHNLRAERPCCRYGLCADQSCRRPRGDLLVQVRGQRLCLQLLRGIPRRLHL